jgi:cellobiose phosphorylase
MYIGPENEYLAGYAPMSWVTGTAGWAYRALTEYICGVRAVQGGLLVKPCFPSHWDNVKIQRIFRGATYNIEFVRSQKSLIVMDGVALNGNILPIAGKGGFCNVTVYFN